MAQYRYAAAKLAFGAERQMIVIARLCYCTKGKVAGVSHFLEADH
jgi:hypothetical protein